MIFAGVNIKVGIRETFGILLIYIFNFSDRYFLNNYFLSVHTCFMQSSISMLYLTVKKIIMWRKKIYYLNITSFPNPICHKD